MSDWKKNFLFATICFVGIGSLVASLVPRALRSDEQVQSVESFSERAFQETIHEINQQFADDWNDNDLVPAKRADDLLIARRIALALIGTIPSVEEIRMFEAWDADVRIKRWTNRLLMDRRHADYLAERLARAFVGTEDGPFLLFRRRRFVTWLSDQLHQNVPYDEIVRDIISDAGLWTDSPAVNFVTVTLDVNGDEQPDEERLAARTTRAFLGVRLDCVQCHDDNMGGYWMQRDFHQLAAFYAEANSSLLGISDNEGVDYRFQYLHADDEEIVNPDFPFAKEIETSGNNRRQRLAHWVTSKENDAFARATVNRFWALMFGKPLVEPIDNIPLEGPYPPGLQRLANDFSHNGFDLRRLVRQIVSTNAFQLDSRANHAVSTTEEEHWALFPLSRLRPEQVAGAIIQSSSLRTIDANSHILMQLARYAQQNEFVNRYGDSGEDEFSADGGTIPQRLLMMNGKLVEERTKEDLIANACTRIAALAREDTVAIETAFLATVSRRPSTDEHQHFLKALATRRKRDGNRTGAMQDLFWALINSAEFSWNH